MKSVAIALSLLAALAPAALRAAPAETLESGFTNMPAQTQPWCYYYWISDNISKEGITKDLEAMARVGIGEALIGNIFLEDVPAGKVKVLTPAWWDLVAHAMREGGRVGVNIGMFNSDIFFNAGINHRLVILNADTFHTFFLLKKSQKLAITATQVKNF